VLLLVVGCMRMMSEGHKSARLNSLMGALDGRRTGMCVSGDFESHLAGGRNQIMKNEK